MLLQIAPLLSDQVIAASVNKLVSETKHGRIWSSPWKAMLSALRPLIPCTGGMTVTNGMPVNWSACGSLLKNCTDRIKSSGILQVRGDVATADSAFCCHKHALGLRS